MDRFSTSFAHVRRLGSTVDTLMRMGKRLFRPSVPAGQAALFKHGLTTERPHSAISKTNGAAMKNTMRVSRGIGGDFDHLILLCG